MAKNHPKNTCHGNEMENGHINGQLNNPNRFMDNGNVKYESANPAKEKAFCGEVPGSQLQEFYKGKSILLTGATGFVGKVLLERLLVSCPGVEAIYMMVREKKGHSISTRVNKIFQSPLFSSVDEKTLSKVYPVVGDMGLSLMGLSKEDYDMLTEKVNIVLHCAANVRFDAPLRELIRVNVKGTSDLLELSRKMKKLVSFVYVSTIFSNYREDEIGECIYEPGLDVDVALALENISAQDEDTLQILNAKILQSWPNLYSFSKCITENAIKIKGKDLPTCIFRPGVVMPTSHEHVTPGFVDNTNGVVGMLTGVAMGIVKIIPANRHVTPCLLPADFCANAIIACAWDTAKKINTEPKVFNFVASHRLSWTVGQLLENALKHAVVEPCDQLYGYPNSLMIDSTIVYKILGILIYLIPGFIGDGFRRLTGKPPLYLKNYKKMMKHFSLCYFFGTQALSFKIRNSRSLNRSLCEVDQKLFKQNIDEYDIPSNFPALMRGVKQYILKEKPHVSQEAYKKLKQLERSYFATFYISALFGIGLFLCIIHIFVF